MFNYKIGTYNEVKENNYNFDTVNAKRRRVIEKDLRNDYDYVSDSRMDPDMISEKMYKKSLLDAKSTRHDYDINLHFLICAFKVNEEIFVEYHLASDKHDTKNFFHKSKMFTQSQFTP